MKSIKIFLFVLSFFMMGVVSVNAASVTGSVIVTVESSTGTGTCSDGIKNQDETGIDTGGVCTSIIDTTPTNGSWSAWTPNISVCPLTSPITQTRIYTPATNGGDDSKKDEPSTRIVNPSDCPTVNVIVKKSDNTVILPATKILYNSKVNVIWISNKTISCTCEYEDVNKKTGLCGSGTPDPVSPFTAYLKKETKYTVTCDGGFGMTAFGYANVLVDDINTNYNEN